MTTVSLIVLLIHQFFSWNVIAVVLQVKILQEFLAEHEESMFPQALCSGELYIVVFRVDRV